MFKRFTVIPAIDLKGGKVVRLTRGAMESATVYGDDPAAVAQDFDAAGAEVIHVVDLDGAIAGEPRNLVALGRIRNAVRCAIEASGGLRTIESIEKVFETGADRVSIGSVAVINPALLETACRAYPGRVLGSLDVRGKRLAIKGWVETIAVAIDEALARLRQAGVAAVIYTDIGRDGTQAGVDADAIAELAESARMPLIASGGVATLADIAGLRRVFDRGVVGVVIGRALYEANFTLRDAIRISGARPASSS